jgi:hypothetical protein
MRRIQKKDDMTYEPDKYAEIYKQRNKYKFRKKYVFILIALVAALTNPSQERHRNAVKSRFDSYIQNNAGNSLATMQGNPFVYQTIMMSVNSTDYLFFSTTNVVWDDDTLVIGFGLFGKVFISNRVDDFLDSKY